MNKFVKLAVENSEINKINLVNTMSLLPEHMQEPFAELLLGMIDLDSFTDSLPKSVMVYSTRKCTFESLDYLNQRVKYSYFSPDARIFKTLEAAGEYAVTGEYDYKSSKSVYVGAIEDRVTDEYPFYSEHIGLYHGEADLSDWMNSKIVND